MFDAVRRGDKRVDKLTVDKIKEIVRKHVEDRLLEDEIDRATRPTLPGAIMIHVIISAQGNNTRMSKTHRMLTLNV